MKNILIMAALFVASIDSSFAERLYLKKVYSLYNSTGPYTLVCKFYAQKVQISETTEVLSTTRVEPITFTGTILNSLVQAASRERLTSQDFGICDGGSLDLRGYLTSRKYITIKNFEDCGAKKKQRVGPASKILLNMVHRYCPSYEP